MSIYLNVNKLMKAYSASLTIKKIVRLSVVKNSQIRVKLQ